MSAGPQTRARLEGWLLPVLLVMAADSSAATPGLPEPMAASLRQFFWTLVLLVVVVAVGILWVGLVRHNIFRRTAAVRQRETAIEDYYRDLFENSHDIVFTLDFEGRIVSMNKAAEETFGFALTELPQRKFLELTPPNGQLVAEKLLGRLIAGESRVHGVLEMRSRTGSRLVLELNFRLQFQDGRPRQIHGMGWNVTERREAEEALRQSEKRLRLSLAERERLGRDLHDGIIQSLYAIGLGLQDCRRLFQERPGLVPDRLAAAIAELNQVIREVRAFIGGIETEPPDAIRFREVLESLVRNAGGIKPDRFEFNVEPEAVAALGAERAAPLLQIAREAVSNSLRHAAANRTRVGLEMRNGSVVLEIRDDGKGFAPISVAGTGCGLKNIRARARELSARCDIESAPGEGTRVLIELPIVCEPTFP